MKKYVLFLLFSIFLTASAQAGWQKIDYKRVTKDMHQMMSLDEPYEGHLKDSNEVCIIRANRVPNGIAILIQDAAEEELVGLKVIRGHIVNKNIIQSGPLTLQMYVVAVPGAPSLTVKTMADAETDFEFRIIKDHKDFTCQFEL